jgi:hypothetical protein
LEIGIYDQWIAISERMKTESFNGIHTQEESTRFEILTLTKTVGIFYLFISGYLASILLFFIEKLLFFIIQELN